MFYLSDRYNVVGDMAGLDEAVGGSSFRTLVEKLLSQLPDGPEVRGMIARVPHLVRVEEVA